MLQVTAKTDYGLLLLVSLARSYGHGPMSLRRLADERRLPYRFLTQIVIPLRREGIVEGFEGSRGGYQLSRPPHEITVGQVIRALEGDIALVRCLAHDGSCSIESVCAVLPMWRSIQTKLNATLDSLTLADLAVEPQRIVTPHAPAPAA